MQATLYAWLSWHGRNKEGYYFTSVAIRRASESPRIANWPLLAAPPRLHPPWRISSAVLRLNRRVTSFYSLVSAQYRTSTSSFFAVNLGKWLAGMVVFTILFSKYPRNSKMSVIFSARLSWDCRSRKSTGSLVFLEYSFRSCVCLFLFILKDFCMFPVSRWLNRIFRNLLITTLLGV